MRGNMVALDLRAAIKKSGNMSERGNRLAWPLGDRPLPKDCIEGNL
jgi:hypothetical protein